MNRKMSECHGRTTAALSSWALTSVLLLVLFSSQLSTELATTTIQANGDSCFLAEMDLSSLDGTNGFAINGEAAGDGSGFSVSYAGDVNGDTIDDIIIGARIADPNGTNDAGTSYIVFGIPTADSTSVPPELELSSLDGTNGFAIHGEAQDDRSGYSVSYAGDVNGDNIDDIIIGAYRADPNGIYWAGKSYVVFGRDTSESTNFPPKLELSSLDGTNGFAINGEADDDRSGFSVSYAGDMNGDNVGDIIVGARLADPNSINLAGTTYVVFGKNLSESTNFPPELELSSLDGTNGLAINGEASNDRSGYSVSYAGDVNGDNIDDIIIGARIADPNGKDSAGTSYVVFGRDTSDSTSFPPGLDLSSLDGTNGFAINGEANGDYSGTSVSYAGDVNGDTIDDIIIGAFWAEPNGIFRAGTTYVVFGKNTAESTNFLPELELSSLDGTNGFAIHGEAENDESGHSVSYAGDVNGDNIDDIIVGAHNADPNGKSLAGKSYVVFGKNSAESASFPSELELSSLNGTNGFAINGETAGDYSGISVSYAGDVNGDNIADIIIGAPGADPNGTTQAGKSYVVFGIDCTPDINSPTAMPTPIPTKHPTTTLPPTNEPLTQVGILTLLFQTRYVEATHDTKAFKDAICEVVSTVTGLQCGENLEVLSVQGTTSSKGEEALLISFEIPKGSIDVDNLDELATEISSELSSSDNEDVQDLPPVDEISYDDGSSSSSMSTEAIVGIAIGTVIALAALLALGYKKLRHQHSRSRFQKHGMDPEFQDSLREAGFPREVHNWLDNMGVNSFNTLRHLRAEDLDTKAGGLKLKPMHRRALQSFIEEQTMGRTTATASTGLNAGTGRVSSQKQEGNSKKFLDQSVPAGHYSSTTSPSSPSEHPQEQQKENKGKKTTAKEGAYPNFDCENTYQGPTEEQQEEGGAVVVAPSGNFSGDMSNIPMAQVIEDVP